MKEKIEEILIRFKNRFYKWIYEDDLRNTNGDIDAPKMEKDLSDFIGQELSTLIQEERKEAVEGFVDWLDNVLMTQMRKPYIYGEQLKSAVETYLESEK